MREQIANRQLFIILFIMRTLVVISTLPVITTADALQDAWLSSLAALAGTLALVVPLAVLGARFPRETLAGYSNRLLGPWLGRLATVPFLWIFLFFAALDVRIYGELIVTGFIPETPLIFIISGMVLVAAVAAYAGLEVIGRMADIILPLFAIMVVLSLVLPLPQADPGNLQPVLARGLGPVLRGALTPIALSVNLSVLAFLMPFLVRPRRALSWVAAAIIASYLLVALAAVGVITIMGPEEAARSLFPVVNMLRNVRISIFLERAEALTVFAWGLGTFVALATCLYAGARGLSQFFGLPRYRALVPPMAVIWVVLAMHIAEDVFELRQLQDYRVMGLYGSALFAAPLALLWAAYGLRLLLGRLGLPGGLKGGERR